MQLSWGIRERKCTGMCVLRGELDQIMLCERVGVNGCSTAPGRLMI